LVVAVVPPPACARSPPRTPPRFRHRCPPLPASPPTWAAGAPRAPPPPVEFRCRLGRQTTVKSNYGGANRPLLHCPIRRPRARFPSAGARFAGPRPQFGRRSSALPLLHAARAVRVELALLRTAASAPWPRPTRAAPRHGRRSSPLVSRPRWSSRPPRRRPAHLARRLPSAPSPEAPPPDLLYC
jgi:hypothetical protein